MKEGLGIWVSPLVFPSECTCALISVLLGMLGFSFAAISGFLFNSGIHRWAACRGRTLIPVWPALEATPQPPGALPRWCDSEDLFDVLLPDVLGLSSSACSLTRKSDTVHWVCDLTLHFEHRQPVHFFPNLKLSVFFFFNIVIIFIAKHPWTYQKYPRKKLCFYSTIQGLSCQVLNILVYKSHSQERSHR